MTLRMYWFLPLHGDGRDLAEGRVGNGQRRERRRDTDLNYLAQVARAAEGQGFDGVLAPFGLFCEDPWLVCSALAAHTERLRFMIALRPGLTAPTLVAQMSATFQRISGGRLLLNVVTGGDPQEQRRYGDFLDHASRYDRTEEFLAVLRSLWRGRTDFEGDHFTVAGGKVMRPPDTWPRVFLGGSSEAAMRVASRHADVYLCWAEPIPQLRAQLARVREQAAATAPDRALEFGTRLHIISRDRAEDAWAVANSVLEHLDPEQIRDARQRMSTADSVGQRRMAALHDGDASSLEVAPNLWTGFSLIRQGPGLTLVGSHTEVADRITELHEAGVEHLILSGQPHLEEAYWVGEGVLPLLRERGVLGTAEAAEPVAVAGGGA
ncbi:LLM class flavin-dependent oxidoreductase [Saccharomonospora xinjiangensis]|uniref:LLM class flavin-dependent oxidoreductase n=1 Tax=Saccharomonospora xinjiangensis TaxID=75294 RepID=UPI00106F4DC6|nr:LLM class flavin-dependent oxidoreductase [Saccharomonospora xinjiangensis]QBQ60764.1 Methanesulfonate monooxygenase [Saccharomonospora xinjiangensis]